MRLLALEFCVADGFRSLKTGSSERDVDAQSQHRRMPRMRYPIG